MTEVNKEELRRLAEAAGAKQWGSFGSYVCPIRRKGETTYVQIWNALANCHQPEVTKYVAAANPAAILSLLDENEALQGLYLMHQQSETREMRDLRAERDQLRQRIAQLESEAIYTAAGVSSDREEIKRLRAENERLHAMTSVTMGVGDGSGRLLVHGDYDSIKAAQAIVFERDQFRAENERLRTCLRETTAVAICGLYDTHPEDVLKAFTIPVLNEVVESSAHLVAADAQVEDLYRRAWDASAAKEGNAND